MGLQTETSSERIYTYTSEYTARDRDHSCFAAVSHVSHALITCFGNDSGRQKQLFADDAFLFDCFEKLMIKPNEFEVRSAELGLREGHAWLKSK